ncbi:uncharacterized protein troap isoform X2 [Hippocampus comes]|uniref:uncharacterized protein troap isoform X2 n=1 Tax=Hippocampus comes TaxID=109280 RepID=UPI00094EA42F|nr:PREDICTED: uncharacterized protein LOC109522759 isoform X2 [Hippocampus comes]
MDSSPPVLRVQREDYFRRVENENNKMPLEPQNAKPVSTPHLLNRDSENLDPGRKTLMRPRVSRLPVLVKSHQPPTAFHAAQWEEKLLSIHLSLKDPMRKQNVPDNLSSHPCDKAEGFQLDHAALLSILHNEGVHVSRQPFATSDSQSCATFPLRVSVVKSHQKATVSQNEGLKTAGSVHATPQNASRKGTYMDTPQRVPITKSLALADKGAEFQPNSASLRSILRNVGVCISSQSVATPRSQSFAMSPQVSVTKSHQKAAAIQNEGVKAAGPVRATPQKPSGRGTSLNTPQTFMIKKSLAAADKAVEFKPDPTSLQSIVCNEGLCISSQTLATPRSQSFAMFPQRVSVTKSHQKTAARQNEGVKVAGPIRATPHKPSGRGTFIDTPQRVPIKTSLASAVSTHKEAKNMWTCQNSPPSPTMQVAQTLFVDQENGRSPDKGKEEQLPVLQASPIKTPCEDRAKMTTSRSDEEEQKIEQGQKFIQSLQRESVICFSTGKKQCRFEKQESSACQDLSEMADVCEPVCRINLAGRFLHRDQKACVSNTALALLPKKLSPMNDLLLDKEVAFYISHSVSDAPRSFPSQPRCINPVASLLHFLESTTFVPLCLDAPSPCSSPLQEK